jgi:hypothetical protein
MSGALVLDFCCRAWSSLSEALLSTTFVFFLDFLTANADVCRAWSSLSEVLLSTTFVFFLDFLTANAAFASASLS